MSELEPSVTDHSLDKESEELTDPKPFVIRGHHLENYAGLVVKKTIGKNVTSRLAKIMRIRIQRSWEAGKYYTHNPYAKYGKDVLGSWNEADKFEEQYKVALETFLQLPYNYPTEIVEGIQDSICGGCAIGEHCRRLFTDDYVGESIFKNDGKNIDTFLESVDDLNLPKPTITQEPAHFSDAEPQEIRRIKSIQSITRVFFDIQHDLV